MNVLKELEPYLERFTFLEANLCINPYEDEDHQERIITNGLKELKKWAKDKNYNESYGIQELDGIVYMKDENDRPVWLTRGEYDGSEWWDVNTIPNFYKQTSISK